MAKTIGFSHGALCDNYETQAQEQGFTLGDSAKFLQELGDAAVLLWLQDCLTDSQYWEWSGVEEEKHET